MNTELAECPYCGNEQVKTMEEKGFYWVECPFCHEKGAISSEKYVANQAWNYRFDYLQRKYQRKLVEG